MPPHPIEQRLEAAMFASRWLLAPFYIGLVISIILLLVKFVKEFIHLVPMAWSGDGGNVIVGVLSLVDIVMIGNLLVLIIFAGYENFVSKIHTEQNQDRPDWMGTVTFADLKIKLIGSIVAISAIELLKAFMNLKLAASEQSAILEREIAWKIGIHITFVISGVLFALTDHLMHQKHADKPAREPAH